MTRVKFLLNSWLFSFGLNLLHHLFFHMKVGREGEKKNTFLGYLSQAGFGVQQLK